VSNNKPVGLTQAESALWVAPLPDDKKPVAKDTKLCVYCSRYHGSINKAVLCLENGVRALREEGRRLQTMLRLERAGREPAPRTEET
jgi:hypothetical protein